MAFTGLSVSFSYVGGGNQKGNPAEIMVGVAASQTIASGGVTTISAPAGSAQFGQSIAHLLAAADGFVAIGAAPNSAADPKLPIQAGIPIDIYVNGGDKVAYTAV